MRSCLCLTPPACHLILFLPPLPSSPPPPFILPLVLFLSLSCQVRNLEESDKGELQKLMLLKEQQGEQRTREWGRSDVIRE